MSVYILLFTSNLQTNNNYTRVTYSNIFFNIKTASRSRNNMEHKAISINNAIFRIKCNIKYCS